MRPALPGVDEVESGGAWGRPGNGVTHFLFICVATSNEFFGSGNN